MSEQLNKANNENAESNNANNAPRLVIDPVFIETEMNLSKPNNDRVSPNPLTKTLEGKTLVIIGEANEANAVVIFDLLKSQLKDLKCHVLILANLDLLEEFAEKNNIAMKDTIVLGDIMSMHDHAEDVSGLDAMMMESETDRMFRTGEFILRPHHCDADHFREMRKMYATPPPNRDLNDRFGSKKKGNRRSFGFVKQIGNPRTRR